ncbi:MAG: CopG family transcriptional regulator [Nitrosotalea sp.]
MSSNKVARRYITLPDDVAELLEEQAERSGISPDKLLEHIITRAATFDIPLSKIDMVESPLPEFFSILECLPGDDIKEIARNEAERNFDDILSLLSCNHNDFGSVIERFYERFSKYSGWFTFGYRVTGRKRLRLSFQHTYGIKWSIFLSEYNKVVLERFCSKSRLQALDDEVIFDVVLDQG